MLGGPDYPVLRKTRDQRNAGTQCFLSTPYLLEKRPRTFLCWA